MPFKSKAQQRFMYAAESRGEVPKGTAARWQKETGDKKLPEKVEKKAMDMKALRAALLEEDDGAWIAGADLVVKEAELPTPREDTVQRSVRELIAIRDPEERKRYLQDMAARNHRLAVKAPVDTRAAVAAQK